MRFEWDPRKDRENRRKHGLSFDQAVELFKSGVDFLDLFDKNHSDEEERFIAIGPIAAGVIVVVYAERDDDLVRIVSARNATRKEVALFVEHIGGRHE